MIRHPGQRYIIEWRSFIYNNTKKVYMLSYH